jgi:hypothetical protein
MPLFSLLREIRSRSSLAIYFITSSVILCMCIRHMYARFYIYGYGMWRHMCIWLPHTLLTWTTCKAIYSCNHHKCIKNYVCHWRLILEKNMHIVMRYYSCIYLCIIYYEYSMILCSRVLKCRVFFKYSNAGYLL